MSNRRKPRRPELQELRFGDSVDAMLADRDALRCRDCDSTVGEPVRYSDRVARLEVRHDDTCPWLRRWTA